MPGKQYKPFPFPPQLDVRKLMPQLKRTLKALDTFQETLSTFPSDPAFSLLFRLEEARFSLESQDGPIALKTLVKERFLSSSPSSKIAAVLRYADALDILQKKKTHQKVTIKLLEQLHGTLEANCGKINKEIGHIRTRQNWIGPVGCTIDKAFFYPPEPQNVEPLLKELSSYLEESPGHRLVVCALFFGQFLVIHPFMDANGRMARLLAPFTLWKKGLTSHQNLYLSRYFLIHRQRYFKTLYDISRNAKWSEWVYFYLQAVEHEALRQQKKLSLVYKLYKSLSDLLETEKSIKNKRRVLAFLFSHPIFTVSMIQKSLSKETASYTIALLHSHKFMTRIKEGYCVSSLFALFQDKKKPDLN